MNNPQPTANCAGKWALFDSTDIHDHKDAANLCTTCPILTHCRELLNTELQKSDGKGGGPSGTWAGQLIRPRALPGERQPPINPHVEEHMFTDAEALAAQNAYQRGERTDRTIVGKRVYARRNKNREAVERALQLRANGWTTGEAARELGTTKEGLQKAIERARTRAGQVA